MLSPTYHTGAIHLHRNDAIMNQYPFSRCRWTGYLDLVFDILKKHYTEAKFLSVDAGKCQVPFFPATPHLEVNDSVPFCSLSRLQP